MSKLSPFYGNPYIVGQVAVASQVLEYSDIVDRSDFRFKDSNAKVSRLSEQDTGTFQGQYDYDGDVPSDSNKDPVSMLVVNLRQGKYSKGEIEDIKRAIDKAASDEISSNASKKVSKAKKDVQDKIDAAIADQLGVNVKQEGSNG